MSIYLQVLVWNSEHDQETRYLTEAYKIYGTLDIGGIQIKVPTTLPFFFHQ